FECCSVWSHLHNGLEQAKTIKLFNSNVANELYDAIMDAIPPA
ncbi:10290_t:CDS:2, partial [Diversispora eburnea]